MYARAKNKINNAYKLWVLYEVTFPNGATLQQIVTKTTKSGTPFSKKELRVVSHVWLDDLLDELNKEYRGAKLRVIEIKIDCYLVDTFGKQILAGIAL